MSNNKSLALALLALGTVSVQAAEEAASPAETKSSKVAEFVREHGSKVAAAVVGGVALGATIKAAPKIHDRFFGLDAARRDEAEAVKKHAATDLKLAEFLSEKGINGADVRLVSGCTKESLKGLKAGGKDVSEEDRETVAKLLKDKHLAAEEAAAANVRVTQLTADLNAENSLKTATRTRGLFVSHV